MRFERLELFERFEPPWVLICLLFKRAKFVLEYGLSVLLVEFIAVVEDPLERSWGQVRRVWIHVPQEEVERLLLGREAFEFRDGRRIQIFGLVAAPLGPGAPALEVNVLLEAA